MRPAGPGAGAAEERAGGGVHVYPSAPAGVSHTASVHEDTPQCTMSGGEGGAGSAGGGGGEGGGGGADGGTGGGGGEGGVVQQPKRTPLAPGVGQQSPWRPSSTQPG